MAVLIADDYAPVRESLRALLEDRGLDVLEAEDGQLALEVIDEGNVDVLVLDLYMPRCDGMEVLRRLRAEGPPVIVLSAMEYITEPELQAQFGARLFRVLRKPVAPQALCEAVTEAAGRR